MTSDEFERIATAIVQMRGYNLGEIYVPLSGVIRILYTNLHPDDKASWRLRTDGGVEKVENRDS